MFDVGARFETAMKDTVEEWKKNENVSGIYVYGSYVKGTVTANSDLDLCVIWAGNEAPVQLLAEYKAVRIDMLFRTIKSIEDILEGKTEDDFKIADVIGMLRDAKVIYDRDKLLKDWQKRAKEYTWSEEVIEQVKKHALDALSAADQLIEAGEEVIAIGCPFSLEQTVTHGIISDTKRTVDIDGRRYVDLIQTDAAINTGNSGGALINLSGEVVGVNVAIYAPGKVYCGIGFAIPINHAKLLLMKVRYLKGEL